MQERAEITARGYLNLQEISNRSLLLTMPICGNLYASRGATALEIEVSRFSPD